MLCLCLGALKDCCFSRNTKLVENHFSSLFSTSGSINSIIVTYSISNLKLSMLNNNSWDCVSFENLPASLVLTPLDVTLGSPVPMALVATTLNSYSTQGLSCTAIADSRFPVTGSGSADKQWWHNKHVSTAYTHKAWWHIKGVQWGLNAQF